MRTRCLVLAAFVLAALIPLATSARTTPPVLTASVTDAQYASSTGSGCAGLTSFDVYDYSADVVADSSIFGFTANDDTYAEVNGTYIRTAMGQRVFIVELDTYSDSDIYESEFDWEGYAALKCLADGTMQFSFKPSYDYYYDQYNPNTGYYVEGDLGGNARVTFTLDLANGGFEASVYAPVTLHQTWAGFVQ
jgi:hypothetical protein